MQTYKLFIPSPWVMDFGVTATENVVTSVCFLPKDNTVEGYCTDPQTPFLTKIRTEFSAYFSNPKHRFSLPLDITGTPFQRKVWDQLLQILPGEPVTYEALAKKLGTHPRAIGNACRTNRAAIIIPCHRVISKNTSGGFAGKTKGPFIQLKEQLLNHERGTTKVL